MPTYEYYCAANQKTLEVMHSMSREVTTWGELCELAEAKPGKTAANEPVEKLVGAGMVLTNSRAHLAVEDCGNPGGCCGGGCAM
ncbi:MAG: zinc ribbon domain-containing protein [Planctomycetota bacterium]